MDCCVVATVMQHIKYPKRQHMDIKLRMRSFPQHREYGVAKTANTNMTESMTADERR